MAAAAGGCYLEQAVLSGAAFLACEKSSEREGKKKATPGSHQWFRVEIACENGHQNGSEGQQHAARFIIGLWHQRRQRIP
jgi:hypothetical protein